MAYQRVPNTVEIRIVYKTVLKEASNIFHAYAAAGYSQPDIDFLANQVSTLLAPSFAALMSVDDQYLRTEIRGLDVENDITATSTLGATFGSVGFNPSPRNISFVVTQRSGLTGRSARGRVYICGIPTNAFQVAAGQESSLTLAFANAYLGAVDGVRSYLQGTGVWDPVIVSRQAGGVKRAVAVTFAWVSSDYRTQLVATRRKRLR